MTKTGFIALIAAAGLVVGSADARQVRGGTATSVHRPPAHAAGGGHAARPGGGGGGRADVGGAKINKQNINGQTRRTDIDRKDVNIHNRNGDVNIGNDVNINVDADDHWDWDDHDYHPIAAAAAITTAAVVTAAVVGSMVRTLPPSCMTSYYAGVTYYNCNGAWYQPQYQGDSITYIVVNAPG